MSDSFCPYCESPKHRDDSGLVVYCCGYQASQYGVSVRPTMCADREEKRDFKRKLALAEARVKELEGLSFWWDGENNDSPRVLINKDDTNANARTLGKAMPRKDQ